MADRMLVELLADERFRESAAGTAVIDKLAAVVGSRNRATEVNRVLRALGEQMAEKPSVQQRIAIALGNGLKRGGAKLEVTREMPGVVADLINTLRRSALETAHRGEASESERVRAIQMLGCGPYAGSTLAELVSNGQPPAIQIAAIGQLSDYAQADVVGILLRGSAPCNRTGAG